MIRFFLILILFIATLSCKDSSGPIPPVKLSGINGEALYVVANGEVLGMTKDEFNKGAVTILLNKDTIKVGSNLEGTFAIKARHFKIIMELPLNEIIASDSLSNGIAHYSYKADSLGMYDLRGRVEYDSATMSFDFKFIVVQ